MASAESCWSTFAVEDAAGVAGFFAEGVLVAGFFAVDGVCAGFLRDVD